MKKFLAFIMITGLVIGYFVVTPITMVIMSIVGMSIVAIGGLLINLSIAILSLIAYFVPFVSLIVGIYITYRIIKWYVRRHKK